jgi:hypothetical protein
MVGFVHVHGWPALSGKLISSAAPAGVLAAYPANLLCSRLQVSLFDLTPVFPPRQLV